MSDDRTTVPSCSGSKARSGRDGYLSFHSGCCARFRSGGNPVLPAPGQPAAPGYAQQQDAGSQAPWPCHRGPRSPRPALAAAAVADIKGMSLSGLLAWLIWLFVHLWYLVGFQNRLLVFIQWFSSFVTHGRGARLITEPAASAARRDQVSRT